MLLDNCKSDVENRALPDVPTEGIEDGLVGSAWTLWHNGIVSFLVSDPKDTEFGADMQA